MLTVKATNRFMLTTNITAGAKSYQLKPNTSQPHVKKLLQNRHQKPC